MSHDGEVLQVSTPGEGVRRRFYLDRELYQNPCKISVNELSCNI